MIEKVLDFVNEHHMLNERDSVIAGVSGGADSVCLLSVLQTLQRSIPFQLTVVHINHQLRGAESDEDQKFVENICRQNGLNCRSFGYDIKHMAKEQGISLEEAGRKARYEAFYQVMRELNGTRIAVAHNKNDNVETILHHLFRGTGIKGLGGIMPVRGEIIRPLLCCERTEIENYLMKQSISYRTDSSNLQEVYTRNKIRLQLLPYLNEQINRQAVSNINKAGNQLQEIEEYLEEQTETAYHNCVSQSANGIAIELMAFQKEHLVIRKRIIRKTLEDTVHQLKDITSSHIEAVLSLVDKEVGKQIHLPYDIIVKKKYNEISFSSQPNIIELYNISIPIPEEGCYPVPDGKGSITITFEPYINKYNHTIFEPENEKNIKIPEKLYTKWFDYDKIKGNLLLRTRREGDFISINKSGGTKKLKSYFIDLKIPSEERDQILLLADGNHILWIIGYRISEDYKVTEKTQKIMKVQYDGGK